MHFMFLVFLGVAKFSNIFLGCLKFLIFFGVKGRCWARAYIWRKNEKKIVFVFSSKFQNCTPWRNDHNLIVPVLRERKKKEYPLPHPGMYIRFIGTQKINFAKLLWTHTVERVLSLDKIDGPSIWQMSLVSHLTSKAYRRKLVAEKSA